MFDVADTPEPHDAADVDGLTAALDGAHAEVCRAQRRMLALIAEADRSDAWIETGARDMAHWVSIRYDVSWWRASRWIAAAHTLEHLPGLSEALATGRLGLEKVVELARFATPQDEADLLRWAQEVSCAAIRERGDLWVRAQREDVVAAERDRTLEWRWFGEERRFWLRAELPAAQGAIVARALERAAEQVPAMPGEDGHDWSSVDARRADALVAMCSSAISADADPDRATVVVHAQLSGLTEGTGGCELEGGAAIPPDTVRRLLCNARVQTVLEDGTGTVVGLGRITREPPAWMVRQVRYRDRECRFPGCGTRRFTEAHHVRWWRHGGRTDLGNLLLICSFHHRLVHEYGWSVKRDPDGGVRWFDRDGVPYHPRPSPGADPEPTSLRAASFTG